MSVKRPAKLLTFAEERKKRKVITLEVKLDVLKRLAAGERQHEISRVLNLAGSTVATIIKNSEKIKSYGKLATPLDAVRLGTRNRSTIMVEMERLLSVWIDDKTRHHIPLCLQLIQTKALSLFETLTKKLPAGSNEETFTASKGWFHRFKARANLHNICVRGEAASADDQSAKEFPEKLLSIIEADKYTPRQVFNVDETGLFWKRMPNRTYIAKEEKTMPGFKVSKDRLTLLLGGNAEGDFKLKPMLVYHSENPRALKGYAKNCLPVIWKSNKKAWVTRDVFEDWFTSYFCPAVKDYCAVQNLDNKALLIMDNAPGHPTNLDDLSDNVKVIFLPPNTTSLIQPMDQGVISTFKAYYIRRTFAQAVKAIDGEDSISLKEFWRNFNIRNAIENISESWCEVASKTMNGVWRKLWEDCVHDFQGFDEPEAVIEINCQTIELARKVGLDEVQSDDIQELIEAHREDLSDQDLIEMQQERAFEEQHIDTATDEPEKVLTIEKLNSFFKFIDSACSVIADNDPNMDRSSIVCRRIRGAINCYEQMLKEKEKAKKQLSLDSFFFKTKKE